MQLQLRTAEAERGAARQGQLLAAAEAAAATQALQVRPSNPCISPYLSPYLTPYLAATQAPQVRLSNPL